MRIPLAALTIIVSGAVPALGAPIEALANDPYRLVAAGATVLVYLCLSALVLMWHAARRPVRRRALRAR